MGNCKNRHRKRIYVDNWISTILVETKITSFVFFCFFFNFAYPFSTSTYLSGRIQWNLFENHNRIQTVSSFFLSRHPRSWTSVCSCRLGCCDMHNKPDSTYWFVENKNKFTFCLQIWWTRSLPFTGHASGTGGACFFVFVIDSAFALFVKNLIS